MGMAALYCFSSESCGIPCLKNCPEVIHLRTTLKTLFQQALRETIEMRRAAVAAVRPSLGHVLLPPKADHARTTVAGFNLNSGLIDEHFAAELATPTQKTEHQK